MNTGEGVKIISLGMAVPPKSYTQEEVFKALGYPREFKRVFMDAGIDKRHMWWPIGTSLSWQVACEEYQKAVEVLGLKAIMDCLSTDRVADLDLAFKIRYFIFSSCTGYQCPSMNYVLARRLCLDPAVEFISNVGDGGCAGALPSIRQAWKHTQLTGQLSLALSCEVSSVCYYPDENPRPDPRGKYQLLRANAIFGDGACAALFGYDDNPKHPYMIDYQSFTDYESQDLLGFEWLNGRLACVLSPEVPKKAPGVIKGCLYPLLARHNLEMKDIPWLMLHPGGKAVIDNVRDAMGIPEPRMHLSREALRLYGNCSSTSVGLLGKNLMETLADEIQPGDWGLLLTVGSGMNSNAVLLKWPE